MFFDKLPNQALNDNRIVTSPDVKFQLAVNQQMECNHCHSKLSKDVCFECDHIVPLCEGGTNHEQNLQLLCVSCHKNKTAEENSKRSEYFANLDNVRVMTTNERAQFLKRQINLVRYDMINDDQARYLFNMVQHSVPLEKNDALVSMTTNALVIAANTSRIQSILTRIQEVKAPDPDMNYWSIEVDKSNSLEYAACLYKSFYNTQSSESVYRVGDATKAAKDVSLVEECTDEDVENFVNRLCLACDALTEAGLFKHHCSIPYKTLITYLHCANRWPQVYANTLKRMLIETPERPWEQRWWETSDGHPVSKGGRLCGSRMIEARMGMHNGDDCWSPGAPEIKLKRTRDDC